MADRQLRPRPPIPHDEWVASFLSRWGNVNFVPHVRQTFRDCWLERCGSLVDFYSGRPDAANRLDEVNQRELTIATQVVALCTHERDLEVESQNHISLDRYPSDDSYGEIDMDMIMDLIYSGAFNASSAAAPYVPLTEERKRLLAVYFREELDRAEEINTIYSEEGMAVAREILDQIELLMTNANHGHIPAYRRVEHFPQQGLVRLSTTYLELVAQEELARAFATFTGGGSIETEEP